ncbi:MAG: class I SAM-dependent methyltransferase [Pseudomonadota bacterium]
MLPTILDAIGCYRTDLLSEAPFWRGHLPFAGVIVAALRPRRIVELGVQHGDSLFTFAEAMRRYGAADGTVLGIDAWEGDAHVGVQQDWVHARVASRAVQFPNVRLVRSRFEDALAEIPNESIDLIHLDGGHAEQDVREDLAAALPKLAPKGVILMHDITAFCRGFGVFTVWQELAATHPNMAFAHSAGLGLLCPKGVNTDVEPMLEDAVLMPRLFAALGHRVLLAHSTPDQIARAEKIGRIPAPAGFTPSAALAQAMISARW